MRRNAGVLAWSLVATLVLAAGPAAAASSGRGSAGGHHSASRGGHHNGSRGGHYSGHYSGHRYYSGGIYVRPWGWTVGWGPYWTGSWGYGWYGPGWGYPRVYPQPGALYGALDFDVSPERAEIWVDGRRIGIADDYDGFPDYLWLAKGTYDVVIYLPGFRTISRQYTIFPGMVIDVEDRLERGESIAPLDIAPKTHERRDERLRRDEENQRRVEERGSPGAGYPEANQAPPDWIDARSEPGRLLLGIEPTDASVYLDGRFVGTGRELAGLRSGLLVDAGEHRLEVVRPGYGAETRSITIRGGEESELRVELKPTGSSPS